jgi:hypothetical protein
MASASASASASDSDSDSDSDLLLLFFFLLLLLLLFSLFLEFFFFFLLSRFGFISVHQRKSAANIVFAPCGHGPCGPLWCLSRHSLRQNH